MEKCYEYFRCSQTRCPAYDITGKIKCWEIQGTLCNDLPTQGVILKHGKNKCRYCQYFKTANPKD